MALNSAQLNFTTQEQEDIAKLWPLFRTPRTVKRYVNIYRLLRAGLASEEEVEAFAGDGSQQNEYQLAVDHAGGGDGVPERGRAVPASPG